MSEGKRISEVNVYTRIPEDTERALRKACADADLTKPKAIAQAIELWLSNSSADSSNTSVHQGGSTPFTDYHEGKPSPVIRKGIHSPVTDPDVRPISPLEEACIERLLRILRSPIPGTPDALISNLATFEGYVDLYERVGGVDQAAGHSSSAEERARVRDERIAEIERAARLSRERNQEIEREIEGRKRVRGGEHGREEIDSEPIGERSDLVLTTDEVDLIAAAVWAIRSPDTTTKNAVKGILKDAQNQWEKFREAEPQAASKRPDNRRKRSGT